MQKHLATAVTAALLLLWAGVLFRPSGLGSRALISSIESTSALVTMKFAWKSIASASITADSSTGYRASSYLLTTVAASAKTPKPYSTRLRRQLRR